MGNCVLAQKTTEPSMKRHSSFSDHAQIESPIKEKGGNCHMPKAGFGSTSPSTFQLPNKASLTLSGNQENMFFDSQAWLDSDCEDFKSVNGEEFTPSCGSTPIHNSFREPPQEDKSSIADPKKQLIELLCESFGSEHPAGEDYKQNIQEKVEAKLVTLYLSPKRTNERPYEPTTTPVQDGKEKTTLFSQCCLPNILRSFSFSESKKRLQRNYCCGSRPS